jgi:type I restriction enzyme R subunit
MYLDKLLKEHRLLQAVARTNRPYKDIKEAGIIIDYVGILGEFKKALEKYAQGDIAHSLIDFNTLRGEFASLIDEILGLLAGLKRDYERKTLLKAVEILTATDKKEEEFVRLYHELRKTFELLGADEIKLEYFESYKWISSVYTYYMKLVVQNPEDVNFVGKFYDKTVKFIHKTTEIQNIEKNLPVISFDGNYIEILKNRTGSKEEKAANILFALHRMVLVEKHQNPIYESLVERVDKLMQLWRQKTKDYEKIYTEGVTILESFEKLQERQRSFNFNNLQYSLLLKMEDSFGRKTDLIEDVKDLTEKLGNHLYPGWHLQITARKDIERELRQFIIKSYKVKYKLSLKDIDILYKNLYDCVNSYAV